MSEFASETTDAATEEVEEIHASPDAPDAMSAATELGDEMHATEPQKSSPS